MASKDGRERVRRASGTELVAFLIVGVMGFVIGWLVGGLFTAVGFCGGAAGVCGGVVGYRRLRAAE